MPTLITGASGFAGGYLARACAGAGEEIVGVSRGGAVAEGGGKELAVDLREPDAVRRIVREVEPDVVYHLAALSSVGRSWKDPAEVVNSNIAIAVNMLEALRAEAPRARVVWVSSCEVYGTPAAMPISEDASLQPVNPYAVSKTSGDLLAGVYAAAYGIDLIRVRPFNHAGPGQLPIFIVSSLARQAAEGLMRLGAGRSEGRSGQDAIGAAEETIEIVTGSPDTRRDFTDVRDVVRAYRMLAAQGEPGVYNVSSGQSFSAADHVQLLAELVAPVSVRHVVDPALVRGREVAELRGANERLVEATGWEPEIPFRETMLDTLRWWQHELASERSTAGTGRGARSTP